MDTSLAHQKEELGLQASGFAMACLVAIAAIHFAVTGVGKWAEDSGVLQTLVQSPVVVEVDTWRQGNRLDRGKVRT